LSFLLVQFSPAQLLDLPSTSRFRQLPLPLFQLPLYRLLLSVGVLFQLYRLLLVSFLTLSAVAPAQSTGVPFLHAQGQAGLTNALVLLLSDVLLLRLKLIAVLALRDQLILAFWLFLRVPMILNALFLICPLLHEPPVRHYHGLLIQP
jgi:hypothetical protein